MEYRAVIRLASLIALASTVSASAPAADALRLSSITATTVTVFKDPYCGCCTSWVEHLRKHGFQVITKDTSDVAGAKRTARVPQQLYSCHTAFVAGYVVEGHVPAADIQRLLADKPRVAGIGVGGMPAGSPGMEVGSRKDAYDVLAFTRDGSTKVFAHH